MPLPSDMREYVRQGNAAPSPNDAHDQGGKVTPGQWKTYTNSKWAPLSPQPSSSSTTTANSSSTTTSPTLSLVTWNVDGWAPNTHGRLTAILSRIQSLSPDVILLQELNGPATRTLLDTPWIQKHFYTSEDTPQPEDSGIPIVQVTLVSKALRVGETWEVTLPSRYERVLVCADVYAGDARVRLVNVHFDSLAHDPSFRPRQVAMAAEIVRKSAEGGSNATGEGSTEDGSAHGVIAGDWNPVMQVDHTLVAENGLTDAWEAVRGKEPGFTWNWDGRSKEPFPPQRLDKVAVVGLEAVEIEVLEPGTLDEGE